MSNDCRWLITLQGLYLNISILIILVADSWSGLAASCSLFPISGHIKRTLTKSVKINTLEAKRKFSVPKEVKRPGCPFHFLINLQVLIYRTEQHRVIISAIPIMRSVTCLFDCFFTYQVTFFIMRMTKEAGFKTVKLEKKFSMSIVNNARFYNYVRSTSNPFTNLLYWIVIL